MTGGPPRIAVFTHDAYGLGHVRRSTRILRAIAVREPRASLLLITGAPATRLLGDLPANADVVKIPTIITSGTEGTRPAGLQLGAAEIASMRSEITLRTLEVFDADVLLVDNFPLGTRSELLPVLRNVRRRGCRTALGLRDIVDPPEKVRRDWSRDGVYEVVERYYDRVLVYGVREMLDAVEAYGLNDSIARKLSYCGFVSDSEVQAPDPESLQRDVGLKPGYMLATVGGGGDGRPLLEAFVDALDEFPDRDALIVTGEFMSPEDRAAVTQAVSHRERVVIREHASNMPSLIAAAGLVVAMGGYNTSAEIIAAGSRAVIVPRTWRAGEHAARGKTGADAEQQVRAAGLARMGLVTAFEGNELSGPALAQAMKRALGMPRLNGEKKLALDGAANVATQLMELANDIRH